MARETIPRPACTGCKRAREKENKKPRLLTRLPGEVTQWIKFRLKTKPLYLCAFCDGPALELALAQHKARTAKRPNSAG